ncbi:lysophospholipase [Sphaerospermopsis aphanizomenoides BCCUSP55]|uniref:alpha/beta hydrolase n=1 Tax=Sphaerospermopsis aphanizomenoides TaxID=459663 RepID=UPI000A6346D2|nr:alpha/beta hydrolase [Sphaerospermopsis aphanizomenoides]MBK1986129.1 lysophospholipase [Sphaerospermopsis aphanizomenoides BCCUSP55]
MTIYHSVGTFKGVGGLDLYYQSWNPEGKVRAILALVHGLGGHSGLYTNVIEYLLPKQYAIYGLDLRGHGQSPGQRGYINTWAEFRDDVRAFLDMLQKQQPGCPIFLFGHSMGGMIVIEYVLRYPEDISALQGVIAVAPSIGEVGVSPIRVLLGKMLSRLWPRFSLNTGLDTTAGSRDPKILATYTQDNLRHTRATARFSTEFFATLAWINAHAHEWKIPLLILHGGADRVVLPSGSKSFYQLVNCPDKLRIEYPGAYHDLHCDINYDQVLTDLVNWMDQHLPIEVERLEPVMSNMDSA